MRLLLETHSFLWFIEGNASLSTRAREHIEAESNEVYLSVGSLWEMAIKVSIGKLALGLPFEALIPQQLTLNKITLLGIELSHTITVAKLPLHHRDPFDRLLVAQAIVEQIPIVGTDVMFDSYAVTRIW